MLVIVGVGGLISTGSGSQGMEWVPCGMVRCSTVIGIPPKVVTVISSRSRDGFLAQLPSGCVPITVEYRTTPRGTPFFSWLLDPLEFSTPIPTIISMVLYSS